MSLEIQPALHMDSDIDPDADAIVADVQNMDFYAASSTRSEKNLADLEAKWKEVPTKHYILIAHFLAGKINDTDAIDNLNAPVLKASIKSVYWIFLIQYAALAILGIVFNLAIIAYFMYHRLYKDVTHAFIINLALCHFVQCTLVLPITLMVMLLENWIFGQFMCFFLPMLQDIPLHVAMISHILIAWDRMRWLSDPLKGRLPAFVCCCATWLTGMVIALPYPIYTIYVEIGDFVPRLDGVGLCVVNLMDDMHEYMRGLFLLMYCGPTVLLAYLYIRTSQELRPPDGPFAVMMFEHRADLRNRQRNSSASSFDRSGVTSGIGSGGTVGMGSGSGLTTITTHTNGHSSVAGSAATRSYDLYNAELDVRREKRKQRNFGSMAAAQVVCLCPLMVLRFARLSIEETYGNEVHFDFTYLMFVWVAFLPTVIFPCIYASQILPRTEQERLRGYFRLYSKRLRKSRSYGDSGRGDSGQSPSSRTNSIEKDENTNTTVGTSIFTNGDGYVSGVCQGDATGTRSESKAGKQPQTHQPHQHNPNRAPYRQGRDTSSARSAASGSDISSAAAKALSKEVRIKKNDVKIKIITEGKTSKSGVSRAAKVGSVNSVKKSVVVSGISPPASCTSAVGVPSVHRRLTVESLDNNSCSNMTSSTYCNGGNASIVDDGGTSNFGDGEDSSIISGMIVQNNCSALAYYDKKWGGLSGKATLRQKDISFSDCGSFTRMDSSSTLERDMEIIDLLERERSMDLQEMIEREKQGETIRMGLSGERRRLPDIEKIMLRSPKVKLDPYSFDSLATTASISSAKETISTTLPIGSDPLHSTNEGYSVASTLNEDDLLSAHMLPHDNEHLTLDEEVPEDFFDKYSPGCGETMPDDTMTPLAHTNAPPVYQYSRRLSRKSSHHSQNSSSYRTTKRDSFNSLNGTDLIAGAFGELDPTQPLTKMSVIENRMMRRSSGRTSSFSSSGRSSLKSRDYNHGTTHSAHPELDFRENIFAEL